MNLTSHLRHLGTASLAGTVVAVALAAPQGARAADYVPGQVIVGYAPNAATSSVTSDVANQMGARATTETAPDPQTAVLKLPPGISVGQAVARLRHKRGVLYAVPNFIAHADSAGWIPDDRGRANYSGGWQRLQWNFLPQSGINAPEAWANLIAAHRPGGRGVVVAVLDTGIAYRSWRGYRRSPDFTHTHFVAPYDFIARNRYPLDREGHGTFVAGTIAEATDNRVGLTGLAYGASVMPVRVLDRTGSGDAATIARGIRYAVAHHAQVVNLSLEFTPDVTAGDIPDLLNAIRYAVRHNVVVVGAAGNDYARQVAYPARESTVISVGASTKDRCLADYSNDGSRLDLVAPGGGDDKNLDNDANCHPGRGLPGIYQMTFFNSHAPGHFGFPGGYEGTSMSTPHVSAAAALVIASGVLGPRPTPSQVRQRLEQTAQPLGNGRPNQNYGWGLLDAGAATSPTPAALPPSTP